jgi:histidyl-tRNA synthetase
MTEQSKKKPQKLKARLPRGLADRGPAEIAATRQMVETIRLQFERYGFEPVETPAIEYTDTLGKFLPDQDRPNEGVFSFQDDDEQWLSLRYDLTAPLARHFAENFESVAKPYRTYRFGWVFRNEKPGPGRFRQFMQFDADTVGAPTMAADAEMCMLAADTMMRLGIERGQYAVKVNNRKLLDGILGANRLEGPENAGKRLTVLRAIDKADRIGPDGVRQLLSKGRKDPSGDFTPGADLDAAQIDSIMKFVEWKKIAEEIIDPKDYTEITTATGRVWRLASNPGVIKALQQVFGLNDTTSIALKELGQIAELVDAAGYSNSIRIDPSVVRGLEYYTGPVYEVELFMEDEKGPVNLGSVGGGGRYDGLVSRFRGEPVPATGFSVGVSRLLYALDRLCQIENRLPPGPVVVTVFGGDIADYQKLVTTLRNANIRAELYLGNPKHSLGQQMKYADKRNAPCAIIQGSDEKSRGEVLIKDLIVGAEIASATAEREDYLKKQAEAQFAVAEDKLVDAVRELLAKHGITH